MNVPDVIYAIRNGLMWIGLGVLLLITAACAFAGLRRMSRALYARLSPVAIGVFAFAAIFATCEAQKRLLRDGGSAPLTVITQEEIAQGWRLESVVTNDAVSYAMPTNGVEYMPWSLGGGYEMHFPLDLGDDFGFPFGTGMVRRLDVLSGGMVESLPRQRVGGLYHSLMSICAAREYASIVPGVGRFWWADAARSASAPYRVKLISWENIFGGRDRTGLYSAQIEFHDDGNYITRSNNVESVYRRVLPFDLDNDGLPNDIDPAPETPLVPSARNQSEAWAVAAFPSNAAEIAALGGYAAWAAARGADLDRRLVSLGITFDDGSAWPALLDFGGVPVVADGGAELSFAIDCGAKVPFSLTAGRLGSVSVTATEPPMRSGEGLSTTESSEIQNMLAYPHERMVGDVNLYLDSPRSGWMCHIAGVSVEPFWLPHFFPGDSAELTATVSDCHSNAYLGCSWHGGAGITFSAPNSLSTTVTYDSASTVEWATNNIDLITQFVGYTLTNHVHFTVGTTNVPPLRFSIGCQEIFFLNDAELGSTSNRAERIRPVTLNLTGPVGTNGTVQLSVQGNVNPVLFQVEDGVTNRVTELTVFPLAVTNDVSYTENHTIYMSCPNLGTGTITATFTPADGGEPLTDSVTFRCIEPLRKLVNSQRDVSAPRIVNPSRLVYGTNAVLCVDYNGPFQESEIHWHVKEGSATVNPTVGKRVVVTPTAADGVVTVEARFNGDEIQPQFVLPVVQPRTIPVKVVVIEPPNEKESEEWKGNVISTMLDTANEIFTQVGIRFELIGAPENVGRTNDWILASVDIYTNSVGKGCRTKTASRQAAALFNEYEAAEGVTMYFVGAITNSNAVGFRSGSNIVIGKESPKAGLAHELGHFLGLKDIYYVKVGVYNGEPALIRLNIRNDPVSFETFRPGTGDWGDETGRGFYERDDTLASVIDRLLMHGIKKLTDVGDIPDNQVYGISKDDQKGFQNVGASNFYE